MPRVILAGAHDATKNTAKARTAFNEAYRIKPDPSATQIGYLVGRRNAEKLLNLK